MNRLLTSMSNQEIEAWADSHETSIEIVRAIFGATNNEEDAQQIWEDPTDFQRKMLCVIAFADTDEDELYWGCEKITR